MPGGLLEDLKPPTNEGRIDTDALLVHKTMGNTVTPVRSARQLTVAAWDCLHPFRDFVSSISSVGFETKSSPVFQLDLTLKLD